MFIEKCKRISLKLKRLGDRFAKIYERMMKNEKNL